MLLTIGTEVRRYAKYLIEKAVYSKSSLQFNIPQSMSEKITNWSRTKISENELYIEDNITGFEECPHVTVFYGILSEKEYATKKLLEENNIKPFPVKLSTITAFQNKPEYDVLKIDIESLELHRIHKLVEKNLDTESTYKNYKPHLTLAYLKKGYVDKYLGNKDFQGISTIADTLEFSSKNGSKTDIKLEN